MFLDQSGNRPTLPTQNMSELVIYSMSFNALRSFEMVFGFFSPSGSNFMDLNFVITKQGNTDVLKKLLIT